MNKYRAYMDDTLTRANTAPGLQPKQQHSASARSRLNCQLLLFGLLEFAVGLALGYYLGAREAAHLINDLLAK